MAAIENPVNVLNVIACNNRQTKYIKKNKIRKYKNYKD